MMIAVIFIKSKEYTQVIMILDSVWVYGKLISLNKLYVILWNAKYYKC